MYKCKMCGAQIVVSNNESSLTCEFCGTRQTVPIISADNIKLSALHNRANSLRMKGEFDQALSTYENIVNENPNDAEAHWGIVLCRYGIEYVDDPKTGKKVITCRRTELKSVFDDIDYKAAINNSDVIAKRIYQAEAEQINVIQKSILVISQNEKPFDIFISYKETDENGKRTRDSVIAQEIYNELTARNYRVFFSRITLESKLGSQYEPYIFSALNSAKVMLVIGTKESHFNSVWVKNEWSRFLSLINTNVQKKYIIPCYRDIDPYELPIELVSFQSQDMNKLGFIQDLIRGIDKLFNRWVEGIRIVDATFTESNVSRNNSQSLLRRSEILINDGEFEKAELIIDDLLNSDPENSKAYFLLLLIELEVNNVDELISMDIDLSEYVNYERALRYADKDFAAQLSNIPKAITDRIDFEKNEVDYNKAIFFMNSKKYELAIELFNKLGDFKDSKEKIKRCEELQSKSLNEQYDRSSSYMEKGDFNNAIEGFQKIKDFKDSTRQIDIAKALIKKQNIYLKAVKISNYSGIEWLNAANEIERLREANRLFREVIDYKDSNDKINANLIKIDKILEHKKHIRKRSLKIFSIFSLVTIVVTGALVLTFGVFVPISRYNKAKKMINNKQYEEAEVVLEGLKGFKDSDVIIKLIPAYKYFDEGDYESGIEIMVEHNGIAKLNYNPNEGIVVNDYYVVDSNNGFIENIGYRDGYNFEEWRLVVYNIDLKSGNYIAELGLSAKWSLIDYDISYILNGGVLGAETNNYTVNDNVSLAAPTKRGYSFLGWTEKLEDIPPKISYTIPIGSYGNKEFTAHWQPNEYKIYYDPNGGSLSTLTQVVLFDSDYALLLPTRDGFAFDGWIHETTIFTNGTWSYTNDISLRAQWREIV